MLFYWCTSVVADAVLMLCHRLRRWPNIKTTLAQCIVFAGEQHWFIPCSSLTASMRRWPNVVLMPGQRHRRWTSIRTALVNFLFFADRCQCSCSTYRHRQVAAGSWDQLYTHSAPYSPASAPQGSHRDLTKLSSRSRIQGSLRYHGNAYRMAVVT